MHMFSFSSGRALLIVNSKILKVLMLPAPITKVIKIYLVYLVSTAGSISVNFVQLNFGIKILTRFYSLSEKKAITGYFLIKNPVMEFDLH